MEQTDLGKAEFDMACAMFEEMDEANEGYLEMCAVDLLFRRMKQWLSPTQIYALIKEVDDDCNGFVELDEFCMMLSKMRGRKPLSHEYFVNQLPRKVKQQFEEVFEILDTDG